MAIQDIAIIGAGGRLGTFLLKYLIDTHHFNITVLARQSSKLSVPSGVRLVRIPDDLGTADQLSATLKGQHALVITTPASRSLEQILLARACAQAGVSRFIPADFGSVDSLDEYCCQMVPIYGHKNVVRAEMTRLAMQHPDFSWTSLVCGHFFDWGMKNGFLHFALGDKQADIFDDGNARWSTSTLPQIGAAVVSVLQHEQLTRNRFLYIQSFCVSQNQILQALEHASGATWKVNRIDSADFIKHEKEQMDAGNVEAIEKVASVLGMTRSNWESKLANELLELPTEDLQTVVSQLYEPFSGK